MATPKRKQTRKIVVPENSLVNRDSQVAVTLVIVLTIGLALAAFVLSFESLSQLAGGSAIAMSWIWPLTIDGFIVVATVASYVLHDRKNVSWYPWLALIVFAIVSILGNAYHAHLKEDELLVPVWVAALVSAAPAVALLVSSHLLVIMISSPRKPKPESITAPAPVAVVPSPKPSVAPEAPLSQIHKPAPSPQSKTVTASSKVALPPSQTESNLTETDEEIKNLVLNGNGRITPKEIIDFYGGEISQRTAQRRIQSLKTKAPEIFAQNLP